MSGWRPPPKRLMPQGYPPNRPPLRHMSNVPLSAGFGKGPTDHFDNLTSMNNADRSSSTVVVVFKGDPPLSYIQDVLDTIASHETVDSDTAIRIHTMTVDHGIEVPLPTGGVMRGLDGRTILVPPGGVLTWDACPDGGLILLPELDG